MTENDLLACVLDLASLFKWRSLHIRPARTEHGWRTAVMGDGKGWPDLTLVKDRLIVAELKSDTGRTTVDQQDWLFALSHAGVECHLWRPVHWRDGTIEAVLRSEPPCLFCGAERTDDGNCENGCATPANNTWMSVQP